MLPVEKCRHAKIGGSKSNEPIKYLAIPKIVCLNYCVYGLEGQETCPHWRGEKVNR